LPLGLALALSNANPAGAQSTAPATQGGAPLGPVVVSPAKPKGAPRPSTNAPSAVKRAKRAPPKAPPKRAPQIAARPAPPQPQPIVEEPRTPLNTNVVATSSNRLGLPVRQTPASVDIVDQQMMREQGYRTTTEAANGAAGVLSGDAAGAPAGYSMRGFSFGLVNVLYNGISIGPQSITSRVMDTSNLDRVEFLKGPSALMSGFNAIGGSVNYVSRQPTTGPIKSELDTSIDSLGTYRLHYGSGGSTLIDGLDYRFDVGQSKLNSFISGDYQNLTNISTQLNYRVNDAFKVFAAVEYKHDDGHAYWGTPLVPIAFSGPFARTGVVSGSATNTFDGTILGPLAVDSRTLTTNYNVADNSVGAQQLWLRGGFEWNPVSGVTIKNQVYDYSAQRHWFDSETYAFDLATNTIDRDRFFVTHNQHVTGDNTDLAWNTSILGMENRFATQLQVSRNRITFAQEGNPNTFPADTVMVVDPVQGLYGVPMPNIRNSLLDTVAFAAEDRLKLNPYFALIGGIRVDDFTLSRDGFNFDGSIPAGQPFTQVWKPVSYRAAYTFEPIKDLVFYSMYATSYDPAAAGIFSVTPGTSLALTSARIYETGVKQLLFGGRFEWTFAAYDIQRQNVYVALTNAISTLAGGVHTQGIELSMAARPIDNLKIWGNVALTSAQYTDFDVWTGNTPSNVAPFIVNAGASYRFAQWRWPVEVGGSVRYVGPRYLFEDDATTMNAYATVDAFASIDITGRDLPWNGLDLMRFTFRVRNLTNTVYAAWSDPGYPDQVYLGAPRTFELAASARW
jgi:iron complex outermembrane recepter protein